MKASLFWSLWKDILLIPGAGHATHAKPTANEHELRHDVNLCIVGIADRCGE